MIYNYSSVVFMFMTYIFCCYNTIWTTSDFLIISHNNIFKCSDHEYLVIIDWYSFISSNISCPNQPALLNNFTRIFSYNISTYVCYDTTKIFEEKLHGTLLSDSNNKTYLSETDLNQLSSIIYNDNQSYSFEVTLKTNDSMVLINNITLKWKNDMKYYLDIKFTKHPTICRFEINNKAIVKDEKCTGKDGSITFVCYTEPLSNPGVQNANWTLFTTLTSNQYPLNWKTRGGYYIDVRSYQTTTSSVSSVICLNKYLV